MATITYNRDTSKDIIPLIQILVDSQGRVLTVGGKALQIDSSASLTNPSVLIDSSDNVYTYNSNAILIEHSSLITLTFIMGADTTGFSIDDIAYTSNTSVQLFEGEHNLYIYSDAPHGIISVNGTDLGLASSCTFTISGTTVTFTNSTYTYTGTTSDTFIINRTGSGGGHN